MTPGLNAHLKRLRDGSCVQAAVDLAWSVNGRFTIHCRKGRTFVYWPFLIFRNDEGVGLRWNITHAATGYNAFYCPRLKDAIQTAKAFRRAADFRFTSVRSIKLKRARMRVKPIIQRLRAQWGGRPAKAEKA